jgi:hypothetical protein
VFQRVPELANGLVCIAPKSYRHFFPTRALFSGGFCGVLVEQRDQVTVTVNTPGGTNTLAGLSVGGKFTVEDYKGMGLSLIIEACNTKSGASYSNAMVIGVGLGRSYCPTGAGDDAISLASAPAYTQCMAQNGSCVDASSCCDTLKCLGESSDNRTCMSCGPDLTKCTQTADCCDGLTCFAGACKKVIQSQLGVVPHNFQSPISGVDTQQCQPALNYCFTHAECCTGLRCILRAWNKCRPCHVEASGCVDNMDCCDGLHCSSDGFCRSTR